MRLATLGLLLSAEAGDPNIWDALIDGFSRGGAGLVEWAWGMVGHLNHPAIQPHLAPALVLALLLALVLLVAWRMAASRRRVELRLISREFGTTFASWAAAIEYLRSIRRGIEDIIRTGGDALPRPNSTVEAVPADLASCAVRILPEAVGAARLALDTVCGEAASEPDGPAFEEATELRQALADLERFIANGATDPQIAARGGLQAGLPNAGLGEGWLRRLLRADLLLNAYVPQRPAWLRLASSVGVVACLLRQIGVAQGYYFIEHPMLRSVNDELRPRETSSDRRGLHRVDFIRRAVIREIETGADPDMLVVDCIEVGYRGPGNIGEHPEVVLHNPIDWRRTAGS